ncbi:MAG TPA: site-2 protease family protein [Candidatus Saccharimonadales bacterium]|nr:site-2 protease family protein [Candidatus Saccharimonadales bacterium]
MSDTTQALIIALPVLFISMTLHEVMHAIAADRLGDPTARLMGRISLNPMKHIDPFFTILMPLLLVLSHLPPFGAAKPVQVNFNRLKYDEFGGAIVGMIGPITNLVIAALAALILRTDNVAFGSLGYKILGYTVVINTGFFIFNSIPWPPLDGSRLLYAFAPRPLQEFMQSIERMGLFGLVIFVFLFFSFNNGLGNLIQSLVNALVPGLLPGLLQ